MNYDRLGVFFFTFNVGLTVGPWSSDFGLLIFWISDFLVGFVIFLIFQNSINLLMMSSYVFSL